MRGIFRTYAGLAMAAVALTPATAQEEPAQDIVFVAGTGEAQPNPAPVAARPALSTRRGKFDCNLLDAAAAKLQAHYAASPAGGALRAKGLLDKALLEKALASYRQHNCTQGTGPASFVVVDFALRSDQPRLWVIDLAGETGLDSPILVTHGVGSDPDDDGYADRFSNVNDSLMSSLGAVRGAEVYHGRAGRSLQLDGLDPDNNLIRFRNIVVHTSGSPTRGYFAAKKVAERKGLPGTSEGCFVVEPAQRDRLIGVLQSGGFLYAGLGEGAGGGKRESVTGAVALLLAGAGGVGVSVGGDEARE